MKRRRDVLAECSDLSGTKIGAVRVIQRLHERGLLSDDALVDGLTENTLRKDARIGTEDAVANAHTPHGPVVTTLNVKGTDIEVVNPFAYVYFLCERNPDLFEILMPAGAVSVCRPIVLYVDEIRPGNPLRPGKSRTTQCVYWIFADMPDRCLSDVDCWFLATTVRSSIVEKIPGKISAVMSAMLKMFF